ncbi:MAG: bifunctional metallophosphatase/5'-nucleotidase [Gammaproteobacteria bacterium]
MSDVAAEAELAGLAWLIRKLRIGPAVAPGRQERAAGPDADGESYRIVSSLIRRIRLAAATFAALTLTVGATQAATTTVKVIAFNDFHGHIQSSRSFGGVPVGGVDALAAHIAALRALNPNSVVVSAGDLIGASPLVSGLFHDEATIETMNLLGLEFDVVGNHEFDEGRAELLRMQKGGCHPTDANSCQGTEVGTTVPFEGAKFSFLAANVVDAANGNTLFPPYGVKVIGGARIAFIGVTLEEVPTKVSPAGIAGLSFLDEADVVNALVPKLRALGIETIVVLIHQGGFKGSAGAYIADCQTVLHGDTASPIRAIVRRLDNAVDLVISGHTHVGYNCLLPNKEGRDIPVTQAGAFGGMLTDIDLSIDLTTGDVVSSTINSVITNRNTVTPDPAIASIVGAYHGLVAPLANSAVASITSEIPSSANAAGEMPAGKLIADAQLAATRTARSGGAAVAFVNAGSVRFPGFTASRYPHDVTYAEAFAVQPFGNSLVTMTLTGRQIRVLLEQQFAGCLGQTATRIMQVSEGFKYSYQPANACGSRIVNASLDGNPLVANGEVVDPTASYRVTVNAFMADGGDGFAVLADGTNPRGGPLDIDLLVEYLASFKAPNAPYTPASQPERITKLP